MWTTAFILPARIAAPAIKQIAEAPMNRLMVFGFLSTFFTLVFFLYQHKSKLTLKIFAFCLAATAVYGFMDGEAALGLVSTAWSANTIRSAMKDIDTHAINSRSRGQTRLQQVVGNNDSDSRISRLFGST